MNPRREQICNIISSRSGKFFSIRVAVSKALCAGALALVVAGCSQTKQTWEDWKTVSSAAMLSSDESKTQIHSTSGLMSDAAASIKARDSTQEIPMASAFDSLAVHTNALILAPGYKIGDGAHVSPGFDLKMRNPDFPRSYISDIYFNLSRPTNGVSLRWTGPKASEGPTGPWSLTPGRGAEGADCNDVKESNTEGSLCTPKGTFAVAGFADHLEQTPICLYVTWVVYAPRYVGIHSHTDLPATPASAGCIRVPYEAAKLIHNNSITGVTLIHIGGTWERLAKKNL